MSDGEEESPPQLIGTDATIKDQDDEQQAVAVKVPITIVTGYLGAGKTTLMNYVLSQQHGKKIAVILNEFGDSLDIEKSLTVNTGGEQVEEWLELGNGCICCSIKDSGVNAIESLMDKKGAFDHILLETTGLADPGNLIPMFWLDEGLASNIYLDGIVTLVDAKNFLRSLEIPEAEHAGSDKPQLSTAHVQISHADVVVINKTDLVTSDHLLQVKNRIQAINGLAKVHTSTRGQVPRLDGVLLNLHAYDDVGSLDVANIGPTHLDPNIATMSFSLPTLTTNQVSKLDEWLRSILWDSTIPNLDQKSENQKSEDQKPDDQKPVNQSFEIHRLKAKFFLPCGKMKIVQGVRDIFEILDIPTPDSLKRSEVPEGKIVLIGKDIKDIPFQESLIKKITS